MVLDHGSGYSLKKALSPEIFISLPTHTHPYSSELLCHTSSSLLLFLGLEKYTWKNTMTRFSGRNSKMKESKEVSGGKKRA